MALQRSVRDLSNEELETELAVFLSTVNWNDLTEGHGLAFDEDEPPPRRVLGVGFRTKLGPIYVSVEWQDGTHTLLCTSERHPGVWKRPFSEDFMVDWIWDHALASLESAA